METYSNKLDLNNLNLSLFLEFVGGRHLMLSTGDGKIIKISNDDEVNFYNQYTDQKLSFIPKSFYSLNRKENPELNKLIMDYKEQLDFVIYEYVRDFDKEQIMNLFINPDINYSLDIFYNFIKKCEENIHLKTDCENLKKLKENICKFPQEKLRFFYYFFIYIMPCNLDKSNFLIIEDLTYGMQRPCIIDIKLGFNKPEKQQNYNKGIQKTFNDFGLRLMGAQVLYF
jgi:hypothetical protein